MPSEQEIDELRAVYELLNSQEAAYRRSRTGGSPSYRYNQLDDRMNDHFPGLVHDEMNYGWEGSSMPPAQGYSPRPSVSPKQAPGGVRGEMDPFSRNQMIGSVMDDRTFMDKTIDSILALGDSRTWIEGLRRNMESGQVPDPQSVAEGFWNPVFGMAGILAGAKSRGIFPHRAEEFLARETSGANPQELWERLGISREAGGDLAYEIPPTGTTFSPQFMKRLTKEGGWGGALEELIQERELFDAYPALRRALVGITANSGKVAGSINPDSRIISLKFDPLHAALLPNRTARDLRSGLEHEMQHWVQMEEGWPGGMGFAQASAEADKIMDSRVLNLIRSQYSDFVNSPDVGAVSRYLRQAGEVQARNAQTRLGDLHARTRAPVFTEDLQREVQRVQRHVSGRVMRDEANPAWKLKDR